MKTSHKVWSELPWPKYQDLVLLLLEVITPVIFAAVRLGRCPKKEKPHTSLMVSLPQDDAGSIDLERQSSLEQMVLNIHESFQKANAEFYRQVQSMIPTEVRYNSHH